MQSRDRKADLDVLNVSDCMAWFSYCQQSFSSPPHGVSIQCEHRCSLAYGGFTS